ncbi:alpha/beta hydrolase [Planctomycetota bacterium]|nr:alpha/beta hydrolase [Planctomycetota bacterium]
MRKPVLAAVPYYKTHINDYADQRCLLDVYLPDQWRPNKPTLVFAHGGGLTERDRTDDIFIMDTFTKQGIAVVSIGYRLSPQATCPDYIQDAAAAIAWTLDNIEQHGGNPNNVYAFGHSAGAYLMSMISLDNQYLAAHNHSTQNLAGAIVISGQMVTHEIVRREQNISPIDVRVDQYAPLFHVAQGNVPFFIAAGKNDMIAREQENALFAICRERANKSVEFHAQIDRDHETIITGIMNDSDPILQAILNFIDT